MNRVIFRVLVIVIIISTYGCATMQDKWEKAAKEDTIQAYTLFLNNEKPDAEYRNKAETRIWELREAQRAKEETAAFERARASKRQESDLKTFLSTYPSGKHAPEARKLLEQSAYNRAMKENTAYAYSAFLSSYPNSDQAPDATARLRKIRFDNARRSETLSEYENFIKQYPEGEDTRELKNNLPRIQKSEEDVLRLISTVNERTINSIVKSQAMRARQASDLGQQAIIVMQLLREYGYTSKSFVWKGDFDLIHKTSIFTSNCAVKKLLKINGEGLGATTELTDQAGAIRLFRETFKPAEIAAIKYEINQAKTEQADEQRKKLLEQAGYDASNVFHLSAKFDAMTTPVSKENAGEKLDQKAVTEYAGVAGIVLQKTFDQEGQYFLVPVAQKLPVATLRSPKDFSRIPLHTDLKLSFAAPMKDGTLVKGSGKAAYLTVPLTDKATEMGGYPGTRLDLSNMKMPLSFLGKTWVSRKGATCIIQITKKRIEASGCAVTNTR